MADIKKQLHTSTALIEKNIKLKKMAVIINDNWLSTTYKRWPSFNSLKVSGLYNKDYHDFTAEKLYS